MIQFTTEQLITITALPTITILLIWTLVIFHKNRKKWGPYDIPIVCILVLSIIRNLSILCYLLINTLSEPSIITLEYCSIVVWMFNSIHTFQASSLTTVAIIGLFSMKLYRKDQNINIFLTPTHIIYHLFCLTTLCACVGVAAILAQTDKETRVTRTVFECKFMPFDLDIKFNIFIMVLHMFLSVISFTSFFIICYNFYRFRENNFEYIKKSNSDLSQLSLGNDEKNYYDTYTIQRGQNEGNNYFCGNRDVNWNSDLSTTVSSTNSKRPCLDRSLKGGKRTEENRTGLETIHPVLIVCYLFYHLPIIILCIYPELIYPWPVPGIALWLGLVQDVLIPVGLGIVDSRFCRWVSSVYRCSGSNVEEKLPHVGLVGKFRTFGIASPPQSLELPTSERNLPVFQAVEHRFPITNGSLYTSIDGRLPVIHNYRRNRDNRRCTKGDKHQANVAFHTSLLSNRHDFIENPQKFQSCGNCETDLCPSHSNLHHLSTSYINKQLNQLNQFKPIENRQINPNNHLTPINSQNSARYDSNQFVQNRDTRRERISHSEESIHTAANNEYTFHKNSDFNGNLHDNKQDVRNSTNLFRVNNMRLSRSEDSLNDLDIKQINNFLHFNSSQTKQIETKQQSSNINQNSMKIDVVDKNDNYSSDDDYITDINENFDSMSSKSCFSITTEANCDFDFFQSGHQEERKENKEQNEYFVINNINNRPVMTSYRTGTEKDTPKNDFRITRSNSKRSLEGFQAYIESEENLRNNFSLQRSNSYMTLEDRCKIRWNDRFLRSSCKESGCSSFQVVRQKVKSEEYLPNTTTVYIEDSSGCFDKICDEKCGEKCIHSIPDFKKVFISEYI
ncbi:uncharacterized protein LOC130900624 [Diorhabda carinulata]|uniref:uncharacterized protein LOC130900624 n=1 Tax=Diorhabda carinulata TaxID=1163345 RepID=UPI0025A1EC04|nr:uncharacterized protein LOC130900624 [Diorhabda carinulata]